MRRKSCRPSRCIPLDNVARKCCINSLENLQQTIKAASSKPPESLVNEAPQMNLQKFIIFPLESKETSVSLRSIPILKDVVLCEHHPVRDVPRTSQGDDEQISLNFLDCSDHLGNAELNLGHESCTKGDFKIQIGSVCGT